MFSVRKGIVYLIEQAPLAVQILIKILDYVMLLLLIFAGYRLFRRFGHRLPMRSWDNY